MEFLYECFAISHIGNQRKSNEDNFYIGELIASEEQSSMSQSQAKSISKNVLVDEPGNRIFAVSDGMGGHEFGEVASYIVVKSLDDFSAMQGVKSSHKNKEKFDYVQDFQKMIDETNNKVNKFAIDEDVYENIGATLSGVVIFPDEAVPFNIGDSVTFIYENKKLHKLTTDDNEAAMFAGTATGKLEAHGKRLTKYFGLPQSFGTLTATISKPVPLKSGQIFIIASDGLTDSISESKISQILEESIINIEDAVNMLIEASLCEKDGGRDNITIVIVKVLNRKK